MCQHYDNRGHFITCGSPHFLTFNMTDSVTKGLPPDPARLFSSVHPVSVLCLKKKHLHLNSKGESNMIFHWQFKYSFSMKKMSYFKGKKLSVLKN